MGFKPTKNFHLNDEIINLKLKEEKITNVITKRNTKPGHDKFRG